MILKFKLTFLKRWSIIFDLDCRIYTWVLIIPNSIRLLFLLFISWKYTQCFVSKHRKLIRVLFFICCIFNNVIYLRKLRLTIDRISFSTIIRSMGPGCLRGVRVLIGSKFIWNLPNFEFSFVILISFRHLRRLNFELRLTIEKTVILRKNLWAFPR